MYSNDKRIVLTLDAGGTNLVFSALRGYQQIGTTVSYPTCADSLEKCLGNIVRGFRDIMAQLDDKPCSISFAFPGPADYLHGVIGDLPNFPAFRDGIALAAYLEKEFNLPVFINNDGSLFAYGEAQAGALTQVNQALAEAGSSKCFHNLLGITFGTGFGAGVVIDNVLLQGDNSAGGDVWCTRYLYNPEMIAEEGVSIRAVQREYRELSGDQRSLTPKDIFDIAEGTVEGDMAAARTSFERLGRTAGDTIATALTLIDGLVVIGGGLAGAHKYFMPGLIDQMRGNIGKLTGETFPRMQMMAYDLDNDFEAFSKELSVKVKVPFSDEEVIYEPEKRVGVMISKLGASRAISIGAYGYALEMLDKK